MTCPPWFNLWNYPKWITYLVKYTYKLDSNYPNTFFLFSIEKY